MKIKQYLKSIAYFQTRHPFLVLLAIFGVSLIAYVGFLQVETVASLENMMPPHIDEIYAFNVLRDEGLGQDIIAIVFQVDRQSTIIEQEPLIRKEVLTYFQEIERQLQRHTDVLRIQSPTQIFHEDIHELSDSDIQQRIRQENEQFSQFVSYDEQTAIMLVFTDVSATDERMLLLAQQVRDELRSLNAPSQVTYDLTGTPIIQQRLGELINEDRDTTQNISTLFVFIITALIFVSFTTAFVPILVVTISVLWLYWVMGFFGLP
ncbi:MAG: MMPL family transporter, partial [Candidatus Woesearchaeota archaeon]